MLEWDLAIGALRNGFRATNQFVGKGPQVGTDRLRRSRKRAKLPERGILPEEPVPKAPPPRSDLFPGTCRVCGERFESTIRGADFCTSDCAETYYSRSAALF